MANYRVSASKLSGHLTVPPSKSHTLRAILFAALAKGRSTVREFLYSPDTTAMIEAVRQLGAQVDIHDNRLEITGGCLHTPEDVIACGNSGQVLRFVGAVAALFPGYTILTGDASLRKSRPVLPLLDGLAQLGAFTASNGHAPIVVKGPFTRCKAVVEGSDSQPISGLLIAGAFGPHPIELEVKNPGEKPWIDLTLNWFKRLGITYSAKDYTHYRVEGNAQVEGFDYTVPGDFSTAAFPIAAALLTDSELTLHNIDRDDCQGDKKIIPILEKMGARFSFHNRTLTIQKGAVLQGIEIDINDCIDALPILAVIGSFAKGRTTLFNGAIARNKESDRIHAMATELTKMGGQVEERPDGLVIYEKRLSGATVHTYHDHRLALALTVAALTSGTFSTIQGTECIAKTYPHFARDFCAIGAKIS